MNDNIHGKQNAEEERVFLLAKGKTEQNHESIYAWPYLVGAYNT